MNGKRALRGRLSAGNGALACLSYGYIRKYSRDEPESFGDLLLLGWSRLASPPAPPIAAPAADLGDAPAPLTTPAFRAMVVVALQTP